MKPEGQLPIADNKPIGSEPYADSEDQGIFIPGKDGRQGNLSLNWRRPEAWVLAAIFVLAFLPPGFQPELVRDLAPYTRLFMFAVPVYMLIRKIRGDQPRTMDSRSLDSYSPPQPRPDHDESRWNSTSNTESRRHE